MRNFDILYMHKIKIKKIAVEREEIDKKRQRKMALGIGKEIKVEIIFLT